MTDRGAVRVIRSRVRLWVSGVIVWISAILALAAFGYMVIAKPSSWPDNLFQFAIFTTIAVALGITLIRPRLVLSNAGVHVVNPLRTTFVRWRDLQDLAIGLTRLGPSLQILERHGRWVTAIAVQPARIPPLSGRAPLVIRVTQELQERAARHRLTDAEPAPETARAGEGPLLISATIFALCLVGLIVAGLATG